MRLKPTTSVHALVCAGEWSEAAQRALHTSLRGQVVQIGPAEEELHERADAVLVVSAPVVFARGALARLCRRAAHPDRIVTRVLMPGQQVAGVALWSAAWLRRHGVEVQDLPAAGLDFDRDHLPHEDPQARAWVRADEVGVAAGGVQSDDVRRWAWVEGTRLRMRSASAAVGAVLGRFRRTRDLARQRRRQGRSAPAQVR